jgi:hypothetical protein
MTLPFAAVQKYSRFLGLCCKSRFALMKNSAGCRRGFRVKM